ncbi:MAG: hypothetical protein JG781_1266 [Peptococcaceae bacterium]|jgi:hypothetical protein|uniref:hypothetical protein n=1 Tax=Thermanaerosceptrum fracticalcis TaxID=1712410 RepID=UPI00068E8903|nr:hypothetical protein [Thermanaerosceptrum fracticalcis]MBZ4653927.1 hypothetical protein [Peptococcaceae bacterium]
MNKTLRQGVKNKLKRIFPRIRRFFPFKNFTRDQVDLDLWGLHLCVSRETSLDVPTELTVVIPRTELRHDCTEGTPPVCDTEIILNSITVVLAPRHPLAGPPATLPSPMEPEKEKPLSPNRRL